MASEAEQPNILSAEGLNMVTHWCSSTVTMASMAEPMMAGEASLGFADGEFDAASLGDVAGDFGGANDGTGGVAKRGDGGGDENRRAVLANASGFEMINALPSGDTAQDIGFFGAAFRGEQHVHGLTDGLVG